MPHIVIEYAAELAEQHDFTKLCKSLCDAAMQSGVFTTRQDIKVRALPVSHYYHDVENQTFVHINVLLMAGRSEAQQKRVAQDLFDAAATQLPNIGTISADIKELNPATYVRRTF